MTINITSLNTNKKEIKGKGEYFSNCISNEVLLSFFTFSFTMMAQVIYSVSIQYQLPGNYHRYQQTLFTGTEITFSK